MAASWIIATVFAVTRLAGAAQAAEPASHAAPAVIEAGGITLRSVEVDLPSGDRTFPGGAAADVVTNNCTPCHSAGMILNQPPLTREAWTGEVNKMLHVYKAPVAEGDVPAIVAYLAAMKIAP